MGHQTTGAKVPVLPVPPPPPGRAYATGGPVMRGVDFLIGDLPPSVSDTPPPWPHRFYADDGRLDRMIADPTVDILDVVAEVERLCRWEARASESYRAEPELLYGSHPWMRFVATGNAAYLGWEPGQQPPRVPEALCDHRKLMQDLRMGVGVALHPKVCGACGASILYP